MRVKITELFPYDGEHDCSGPFTMEEVYKLKTVAGIRPSEYPEALETGDVGLVVALAIIALRREDHDPVNELLLWKAKVGQILLDLSDDGDDAVPPPATNGDLPGNGNESSGSSGLGGSSGGESQSASDPSGTGTPPSDDVE